MRIMMLVPPSKFARNVARDLVYGCWCKGKRIAGIKFPPMSLLSVATVLKNEGFDVVLLDAAAENIKIELIQKEARQYDIAIMLTSTMTLNEDAAVLEDIKKSNPAIKSIVFGGHVSAEAESTLSRQGIDIVVRREAEYIIRDVLRQMLKRSDGWMYVPGISYREDNKVIHNPDYPLIDNLDELPIPDRTMLPENVDYFNPIVKRIPYTTMFTSRGCPGQCIFCSSPTFYGRAIRFRSAESVLKEIKVAVDMGYREIFFRDEIFTISKKRVMAICQGIIDRRLDVTWICSARIGSVDEQMMRIMKKAGCHMIRLGVETGNQELLDNIKKGITLEQTREVFRLAHDIGLDTHAHMMIGVPGETQKTLERTIKFTKELDPTIVTFGIMTPYPGTPIFNSIRAEHPDIGDGTQSDISHLHTRSFYNQYFTELTEAELSRHIRNAYRSFYIRPGYIFRWLMRIRSLDELKRVTLAATMVFDFSLSIGE